MIPPLSFTGILATPAKKLKHSVESWANSIPVNVKPNAVPSLAYALSHSTGHSVLTNSIAVTHTGTPPVQIKPDPDSITIHDGLSDNDEIRVCHL